MADGERENTDRHAALDRRVDGVEMQQAQKHQDGLFHHLMELVMVLHQVDSLLVAEVDLVILLVVVELVDMVAVVLV